MLCLEQSLLVEYVRAKMNTRFAFDTLPWVGFVAHGATRCDNICRAGRLDEGRVAMMYRRALESGLKKPLLLICMLAMMLMALAPVSRALADESGPVSTHEPQTCVVDMSDWTMTVKATGEVLENQSTTDTLAGMPALLPGDSVEVVPEPIVENGASRKGFWINDNANYNAATKTVTFKVKVK